MKRRLDAKDAEITQLNKTNQENTATIDKLTSELSKFNASMTRKDDQISNLTKTQQDNVAVIASQQSRLGAQQQAMSLMQQTLDAQQRAIAGLQTRVTSLDGSLGHVISQNTSKSWNSFL